MQKMLFLLIFCGHKKNYKTISYKYLYSSILLLLNELLHDLIALLVTVQQFFKLLFHKWNVGLIKVNLRIVTNHKCFR